MDTNTTGFYSILLYKKVNNKITKPIKTGFFYITKTDGGCVYKEII